MVITMSEEYYIIAQKYGECIDYLKSMLEVTTYEVSNSTDDSIIELKKISFIETDDMFKASIIIRVSVKEDINKIIKILTNHKYSNIIITKTIKIIDSNGDEHD